MTSTSAATLLDRLSGPLLAYPYKVWGYGESIGLDSLLRAVDITDGDERLGLVERVIDGWIDARPLISYSDHVAPGFAVIELYERTGRTRYLDRAGRLAQFFAELPRLESGAAIHRPDDPALARYVYVDCMYTDAPFLSRYGRVVSERSFTRLAGSLLLGHVKALRDESSGLFSHVFDRNQGKSNGVFWARGNGWASLGLLKTLMELPADDPSRPSLAASLEAQAARLAELQDPSGHWHTVLDRRDTYFEISATAFFCATFLGGVASGILPPCYCEPGRRAWRALVGTIDSHGVVQGVSKATPPGTSDSYNTTPTGGVFPWGQGPAILACAAELALKDKTAHQEGSDAHE